MIEALAAIGLAGNIVQFVSFSFALVSKSKEIHQSASGLSNEIVDLNIVSEDIRTFSRGLLANATSSKGLSDIAKRCDAIAEELLQAISQLRNKQTLGKGSTRWQSFRKALKCVWGKDHIDELKARLELLRDQVTMHLVSDTSNNQVRLLDLLEEWKVENMQAGFTITAQIQALDVQLQATQERVSNMHSDSFWTKLHDQFLQLSSKVRQLSRCHTIIASLRYECMEIRQDAIRDAHKRTFDWMFSSHSPDTSVQSSMIGFAEWLQHDSDIYWVTGKPGSGKSTLMKYLYDHDNTIRNLHVWSGNTPLVRACFYFWNPGQQMQKSLEGLLQTLLCHILYACPDLAPAICPKRWTEEAQPHGTALATPWTLTELQKAFDSFKKQTSVTTKFYFHVDGLDEYYGDSWDVIETLRDLSTAPNVKLCLSSRPWNCFQDSFGRANTHVLRLHEFTRPDIELFARENLLSHGLHGDFEPTLFDDLVRDIGDRAQGVFLWVRLVVRSLRDGITNEDPISILQERLRAIPSDLERFFEQILGSVEEIYRTRMASTFLAALRSHQPLKIIHYYFLEQGDTTFGFDLPSKQWKHSQIQKRVLQTERRLNGRFKGLLEPASAADIGPQTTVDFLHRTLRDFLATKRMREKLQSWAAKQLNVFTAISRALIAESKFIEDYPATSSLKLAVELASRGAIETGNTAHCFEVIDQAELASERTRPIHPRCGLNCYMVRFAASLGHTDYVRYRVHKGGVAFDLDHILKHAISCPLGYDETYDFYVSPALTRYGASGQPKDWFVPSKTGAIGNAPLPSLVELLFGLGADPNTIVDCESSWAAFAGEVSELMDGEQKDQCWAVFEIFLKQGVDANMVTDKWAYILHRKDSLSEDTLRNTLRYFKCLFSQGLDPNAATSDSTLTKSFLRMLALTPYGLPIAARGIQHDLLREFLRYGADVTQIYHDTTAYGWLKNVFNELQREGTLGLVSPRTAEYRMLLEHGLDPNATTHSGNTVWEHLLAAMYRGTQQNTSTSENSKSHASARGVRARECSFDHDEIRNKEHFQTIHYMILVSLQYGANPHASKLQELMLWMRRSRSPLLSDAEVEEVEVEEVERALQREMDRHRFLASPWTPSSTQHSNRSNRAIPSSSAAPSRQDQKRNHERTSHRGHNSAAKRVRFSSQRDTARAN